MDIKNLIMSLDLLFVKICPLIIYFDLEYVFFFNEALIFF